MKRSEIVTLIIIFVVLLAIFAGALYLGGRHRLGGDKPFFGTSGNEEQALPPSYLYCQIYGKLMRFDTANGVAEKLCGHADADVSCILERAVDPIRLCEGKLYFGYQNPENMQRCLVGCYDIESGAVHETGIDFSMKTGFFVHGGYIYTSEPGVILRYPEVGGNPEIFAETDEVVFMVADGKVYTYGGDYSIYYPHVNDPAYIFSYDVETRKKNTVLSFNTNTDQCVSRAYCTDGRIYLLLSEAIADNDIMFNAPDELIKRLYSIDTETDECRMLFDTYVDELFLSEDSVIYIPYEERTIASGQYTDRLEVTRSASIRACDLDGNNDRVIYTNYDILLAMGYYGNGTIFGSFFGKSPGIDSYFYHAALNLATGEIKKVVLPK